MEYVIRITMSILDEIDAIANEQKAKQEQLKSQIDSNYERVKELHAFAVNTPEYLLQLNREYERYTSLNDREMAMLCIVAGMQVFRQHYLTRFTSRFDDQTAAKDAGYEKTHSDRHHRYYNPTLEEILNNPVPFDANIGSNGALAGGGRMGHRVTALGHDPLLGLIFGTANIATSTLTNSRLDSYHIRTYNKRDVFAEQAKTGMVLQKTAEKFFNGGLQGKLIVGCSFLKELQHLHSDVNSTNSLPLPGISAINSEWAAGLAEYGFDFANAITVAKQVLYARLINSIIAMYHFSFYDGSISKDLYKVKTKKIICYSNTIANGENMAEVLMTNDYDLLDIGGIANTIFEIVTSVKFMKKVKRDYVKDNYDAEFAKK